MGCYYTIIRATADAQLAVNDRRPCRVILLTNLPERLIHRFADLQLEDEHAINMARHDIGTAVRLHILHRETEAASCQQE